MAQVLKIRESKKNVVINNVFVVFQLLSGHFIQNLHYLLYLYGHYKLILQLAGVFGFLQMILLLNKFAQSCISLIIAQTCSSSVACSHFCNILLG